MIYGISNSRTTVRGLRYTLLLSHHATCVFVYGFIAYFRGVYYSAVFHVLFFFVSRPILSPCVIRLSVSEKPLHSQSLSCFMHIIAITVHERSPPQFIALSSPPIGYDSLSSNGLALMFLKALSPTRAPPALPACTSPEFFVPHVPSARWSAHGG